MHSFYFLTIVIFTLVTYSSLVGALNAEILNGVRSQSSNLHLLRPLGRSSNTCPSNYKQCGDELPSNFCCGSSDSCLSLVDATTVVCCPEGEDCDKIQPITCNIAGQNASAFPTAVVHTTNLTGELPACGTSDSGRQTCCPFGYECNSDSQCERSKSASSTGSLSVDTASFTSTMTISSSTSSATALIVASSTISVPVTTSTSQTDDDSSANTSSTKARTIGIAAGSAVGGIACIGGIIISIWLRRRRQQQQQQVEVNRNPTRFVSQYSETPPPLPPKEPYQVPRKKRKSMLSWVPSIVNRTPAELPATPVSFSAWNRQWGQVQPPNAAHNRPHPRDSLSIEEIHELEATWLPQERHIIHRG